MAQKDSENSAPGTAKNKAVESSERVRERISFWAPRLPASVWEANLHAEDRVVNRGKNIGYVECDVTDQDGKAIAKAHSTCYVPRGDRARKR